MRFAQSRPLILAAFTLGLVGLGSSVQASSLSLLPVPTASEVNAPLLAQFPFPDGPGQLSRRDRDDIEDRLEDRFGGRRNIRR